MGGESVSSARLSSYSKAEQLRAAQGFEFSPYSSGLTPSSGGSVSTHGACQHLNWVAEIKVVIIVTLVN